MTGHKGRTRDKTFAPTIGEGERYVYLGLREIWRFLRDYRGNLSLADTALFSRNARFPTTLSLEKERVISNLGGISDRLGK